MVKYKRVLNSWNLRSSIPKEVLDVCKKINVYLPCYLYGECLGDIIFLNKKPDFFQIISELDKTVVNQLIPGSVIKTLSAADFRESKIVEANINGIKIVVTPLGIYKKSSFVIVDSIEQLLLSTPFYHNSFIYDVAQNTIGYSSFDETQLFRPDGSNFAYKSFLIERRSAYLTAYDIFKYALAYKRMSYLNSDDPNNREFIRDLYNFYDINLDNITKKMKEDNINTIDDPICFRDEINEFLEPHVYLSKTIGAPIINSDMWSALTESYVLTFLEDYLSFLIPQFRIIDIGIQSKNALLEVISALLLNSYYDESSVEKYKYLDGKYGAAVILVSIFDAIALSISPSKEKEIIMEIFNENKIATLLPSETVALVNKILTFYKKINLFVSDNFVTMLNSREPVTPISLVLLTKEAKKEFGEYYMVALAPLLIRVGINIFDKSTDRIINTINNSIEETKEDVQISEFVDESIRKFIVDNNYYLSPSMFRDFIAPILKNKVKNNIISGDADSIIKAIEEILILL